MEQFREWSVQKTLKKFDRIHQTNLSKLYYGLFMLIYLAVLACAVVLGLLVYRYDLYEKEPWPLILLVFALGAGTGWLAGVIEDKILLGLGARGELVGTQAWVASLTEELFKLLIVLFVAFLFRKEFNDPMDGLIYGAFAGLGAAVEESFFYLGETVNLQTQVIGTELIRLLLHVFLGGLAGFGVGLARFRLPYWAAIFFTALTADLLLHFSWDYYCGIAPQGHDLEAMVMQRFIAIGLMLTALGLFGLAVFLGSQWSRDVHAPESSKRLWGWPFSLIFGSGAQSEPEEETGT